MRWLKWIGGVVLVLLLMVFGGGWLLSPTFSVVRSTTIDASPDRVYGYIVDPKAWARWTVWNQRDPAMQMEYGGAASGAGATWNWTSDSQGSGQMRFTKAEANQLVVYELFFPDFESTSTGELRLASRGAGTEVTWTMDGDMGANPINRWFALFSDQMIGPDFEAGLANLKTLAENGAAN